MYMFINALLAALAVQVSGAQRAEDGPACRAELKGRSLLTTIEFPTGRQVEGPWRVVHAGMPQDGSPQYVLLATLDRVIEKDGVTGGQHVIPFTEPLSLAFEGATQQEIVQRAARVWCVTVMRAQENQSLDSLSPQQHTMNRRVAVLEEDRPQA
jgi:hypothetical protein